MKKSLLLAIAFSSLVAAPALATDLAIPRKAPVYVPPPPPPPTWSSCYIGGEGGGLWARKEWFDNTDDGFFGQSFGSHTASGWLAGIQAGCDWQFNGAFVVGIQADYDWADAKASNANLILSPGDFIDESRVKSVGSATVRLGYAWGSFLGYVKGGAAWEHDEFTFFDPSTFATAGQNPRYGWTVGVGGEYLFTPWLSGFIEYDYYGFSNHNLLFSDGTSIDIHETKNAVKAGLNFRFSNWWGRY
jgi:outer membrane immunogenic protein